MMAEEPSPQSVRLRERLLEIRTNLINDLEELLVLAAGLLALLASVGAALAALDAIEFEGAHDP